MGVWAFGRRLGTVRACGGGLGSTYLVGYLCSLSFPFGRRGVACNNVTYLRLSLLTNILSLVLLAAAAAHLLVPCAPYASGCVGMLSLLFPMIGQTPLLVVDAIIVAFFVAWRVTYLYLFLCLCVCARFSAFLSLQAMVLVRGGGGRVVLPVTCSCRQAFLSLCMLRAGVRVGHP